MRGKPLLRLGFLFTFTIIFLADLSAEPFTISTSYGNLLSREDGSGMLDRILTEALARTGREVEFVFLSTAECLPAANNGIVDADMNRIAGLESRYPNLIRVPEPNMTMNFVAFSTEEREIDGWESLRDLDIGIVRGWIILEEATRDFPWVTIVPSEDELFGMLRLGRIDVALYSRLTGLEYVYLKGDAYSAIHPLDPPLESRDMFLYVNRKHEAIVDDIAEALRSMKADGTWDAIVEEALAEIGVNR